MKQRIKEIELWPRRTGRKELLRHLRGERLTRDEAIKARCYECGGGEDTEPCMASACPLTQFCPRNRKEGIVVSEIYASYSP